MTSYPSITATLAVAAASAPHTASLLHPSKLYLDVTGLHSGGCRIIENAVQTPGAEAA